MNIILEYAFEKIGEPETENQKTRPKDHFFDTLMKNIFLNIHNIIRKSKKVGITYYGVLYLKVKKFNKIK